MSDSPDAEMLVLPDHGRRLTAIELAIVTQSAAQPPEDREWVDVTSCQRDCS
jgi:hypothetical protein